MVTLKERISPPLEAGPSILDAPHLPPRLAPALEFVSNRLAAKSLRLSLVLVRRHYQISSTLSPSPGKAAALPFVRSRRRTLSSVSALRHLVRTGSRRGDSHRHGPLSAPRSDPSPSSPTRAPSLLESSPFSSPPPPTSPTLPLSPSAPATSATASSSATTNEGRPLSAPAPYGVCLVHSPDLPPETSKLLSSILSKAVHKFRLGDSWLSPALSPDACRLPSQLFYSSVAQNEVLFSSEGLTLMSLDRLYSLKCALATYCRTGLPARLEDAVDELRRLVLTHKGAMVARSTLLRSFDWLSVSHTAIVDLDRMYRRAYGGPEQVGAISGMTDFVQAPIVRTFELDPIPDSTSSDWNQNPTIGIAITTMEPARLPLPNDFISEPRARLRSGSTATSIRPETAGRGPPPALSTASPEALPLLVDAIDEQNSSSIDEVLSGSATLTPRDPTTSSAAPWPLAPDKYHDNMAPMARDEWGIFVADRTFLNGRRVVVETW